MKAMLSVLACLLLPMVPLRAIDGQTFTGGIRGVLTDANGVLPGATVTLTNEATNVSRDTVDQRRWAIQLPCGAPGTYAIKMQLRVTRRSTGPGCASARSSSSRWT